jgi:Spy/CpxP family protein refolding chaperone
MKSLHTLNKIMVAVTAVLGLTLCSLTAIAQPERQDREQKREHRGKPRGLDQLIAQLNITDENTDAFLSIMHEQHKKRMDIHNQSRGSREQEREAMDLLYADTIERLQAVLSIEQLQQFEQFVLQNRPPKPSKRGEGRRQRN